MYLQEEQVNTYEEKGFILLDDLFSEEQIESITTKLSSTSWEDKPGTVLESDGKTLRGIHEDPTEKGILEKISKHPCLVKPAMQLLGSQVYIHQLKINFKAGFSGEVWPWHQDYIFWNKEDGMPTPRAINVMIFLDEVNEFNGPLCLIPNSHQQGLIDPLKEIQQDSSDTDDTDDSSWESSFQADLKYTIPHKTVGKLVEKFGIEAPKGSPGSILFFHPNCIHGSTNNISPFSRKIAIITYNSVKNIPVVITAKVFSETVPYKNTMKILDAGAGTGEQGVQLVKHGYKNIDITAFDPSKGMLGVAKKRNIYSDFSQGFLPDSGFPDKYFDAVICVGTFTPGHAPAESLRELVRITKKGGYIVYSIRKHFYEDINSQFQAIEEELTKAKKWKLITKTEDEYLPVENIKGYYFSFQVLE